MSDKKNKKLLGLSALFALLFVSKDKINKKIEEKKEEIAKEQWTKKNSVTLISMQELEKRLTDEEDTLDSYINAEDKEINITDISDFWRFPSDSEGVSYLNSLYILPYVNPNYNFLMRKISLSYIDRDTFTFRDKKNELYRKYNEYNFFIFDTKNKYQSKYNYSDLQPRVLKEKNNITLEYDYREDETLRSYIYDYGSTPKEIEEYDIIKLGQYYKISDKDNFTTDTKNFSLNENNLRLFKVKSFGFKKNSSEDIGVFLFIPFSFFCPKIEKGRKFTFENLYIDDILIQTKEQEENNAVGGLNNGLNVLSLLNNEVFKSDEILFNKKNQIDLLNFIKKDYIEAGENNFILPLLLYFPTESLNTNENVGLYAHEGINIYDLFFAYYYRNNKLNLRDDIYLDYFLEGVKKIKKISFTIHYSFNELGRELSTFKIICKFGEMEDKVDLSNIGNSEIISYSTKYPSFQECSGILTNLNIGPVFTNKVEEKDYDNEFFFSVKNVFQDETIRNYQNNFFSENFNNWINHNIVFDPCYTENDIFVEYPKLK